MKDTIKQAIVELIREHVQGLDGVQVAHNLTLEVMPELETRLKMQLVVRQPNVGPRFFMVTIQEKY